MFIGIQSFYLNISSRKLWKLKTVTKKQIGDLEDYCSEDVAFCHLAKEAGFKIFIDPQMVVGHEKMRILT